MNWEGQTEVHILSSENVGSDMRSKTFQGRDLFAPIAGKLASGISFDHLGKPGKLKDTFPPPQPRYFDNYYEREIVYMDRFDNLATNLPNGLKGELEIPGARILRAGLTYADPPSGEPKWLPGSDGYIEIALDRGSAAECLNLKPGDRIRLHLTEGSDSKPFNQLRNLTLVEPCLHQRGHPNKRIEVLRQR